MNLKLMYITNRPEVAKIAEAAGVDRIFVDLEYIGKELRQKGMNTVKSNHTVDDVKLIRSSITTSELLVRVNPIHEATNEYSSSRDEIDAVIKAGADIVMLPFFKSVGEAAEFIRLVGGRAKTMLLFETPESVDRIDEILSLEGIDEVYVGLNDLSLAYKKDFMFELLVDGTIQNMCFKFWKRNLPFGFGGVASLGKGLLPSEYVIREHYKMGSSCVILSRSFCNVNEIDDLDVIKTVFEKGITDIRNYGEVCEKYAKFFIDSEVEMYQRITSIAEDMKKRNSSK